MVSGVGSSRRDRRVGVWLWADRSVNHPFPTLGDATGAVRTRKNRREKGLTLDLELPRLAGKWLGDSRPVRPSPSRTAAAVQRGVPGKGSEYGSGERGEDMDPREKVDGGRI